MLATLALCLAGAIPTQAQLVVTDRARRTQSTLNQAEILAEAGRGMEAADLVGKYLADTPADGRAWLYLGRLYMGELRGWHLRTHQGEVPGPVLLDLASVAFDQAQQLLTDSGAVLRTLVTVEEATLRIEERGWNAAMAVRYPAVDLPLPTVVGEMGQNLLMSCPRNGLLITGTDVEAAAVWGSQLQRADKEELMILRPDLYQADLLYRTQMERALGVIPGSDLRNLIRRVRERRPVCLTPGVDTLSAPGLGWAPSQLVMFTSAHRLADSLWLQPDLSVHQLTMVGLAGSVWSAHVRDLYDVAARLNPMLCSRLFKSANPGLPSLRACSN